MTVERLSTVFTKIALVAIFSALIAMAGGFWSVSTEADDHIRITIGKLDDNKLDKEVYRADQKRFEDTLSRMHGDITKILERM